MKQFFTILKFELSAYFKNKLFMGLTLVFVLAVAGVLSFPRISGLLQKEDAAGDNAANEPRPVIFVSDSQGTNGDILQLLSAAVPQSDFVASDKTVEELKVLVDSEECDSALFFKGPLKYTYIVKDAKMFDETGFIINEALTEKYKIDAMSALGVSADYAQELLNSSVESEVIKTGKDQMQNFYYTYILIFVLYMAIILYGQLVATSVATEKSSRAMEMLITCAKPSALMFGKIIGSGLAGLLQISAVLFSSFIFYNLNKSFWADNWVINSIFNMPLSILIYTILFFVLGYFIYAFLFGVVGSLASKVEDINTSSMPITILFILAFFVVVFSMSSGNVDSPLMIFASYFPFTSPMAMFVRISMGDVSPIGIVVSVIILLASTAAIGILSAKIYKIGVMLYGTPPKLSAIMKNLKK
ncbi:MAG: ABC transporter permease [Oscillospiraceae bacterium]